MFAFKREHGSPGFLLMLAGFIGNADFALSTTTSSSNTLSNSFVYWFWNWAFAAASTTILSGAIAERSTYHSYVIYSFFMTSWVYPVVVHWVWAPAGWLSAYNANSILGSGAIDFSGSGRDMGTHKEGKIRCCMRFSKVQ
jgi:ammonium transporter, Amt family